MNKVKVGVVVFREREISELLFWIVKQCQVMSKLWVVPIEVCGKGGVKQTHNTVDLRSSE